MSRLLLLGCSKRKRDLSSCNSPSIALDLYDGPNYRVVRRFRREKPLECTNTKIFVVSARWGIISANTPIESYDMTLRNLSPIQRSQLSQTVSREWKEILRREHYNSIFVGMGKEYGQLFGSWQTGLAAGTSLYIAQGNHGQNAAALKEWLESSTISDDCALDSLPINGDVRLAGRNFHFSSEFVFSHLRTYPDELPTPSRRFHSYCVQFEGKQMSPKWLVSELTGLPVSSYNTGQACRALISWGIEVVPCSVLAECRVELPSTE